MSITAVGTLDENPTKAQTLPVPIVDYTLLAVVNFNKMTEQEQKHWFELGKQTERNERTYFTSKEFWFGLILGMLTAHSLTVLLSA